MALRLGIFQHHLGAVLARNFLHDGQAQPGAVRLPSPVRGKTAETPDRVRPRVRPGRYPQPAATPRAPAESGSTRTVRATAGFSALDGL